MAQIPVAGGVAGEVRSRAVEEVTKDVGELVLGDRDAVLAERWISGGPVQLVIQGERHAGRRGAGLGARHALRRRYADLCLVLPTGLV